MAEELVPQDQNSEDESRRQARELERLESLRERLYARGNESDTSFSRHNLSAPETSSQHAEVLPSVETPVSSPNIDSYSAPMTNSSPRRTFRLIVSIVGILLFVGALVVSGLFFFTGGNTISGNNITIDVTGPVAVGGGEVMELQVAVSNLNTRPIESATVIVTYPKGVQSVVDSGKELYTERIQLDTISPNELINVPIRMLVFGEENDTKIVNIAVEYRVSGSNATFSKEALPYEFKINTSPVVMSVHTVKSIPSGQEIEMEVVVQSNSSDPLSNLLVKVDYPQGFEFIESDPETVSAEDTWNIATLKSGEDKKIRIKGVVTGNENEVQTFDFIAGVGNERDAVSVASPLAKQEIDVRIERPFLNVAVNINGDTKETVVIDSGSPVRVHIDFSNALNTTVYDGVITVKLGGNALNEVSVKPDRGYYDSVTNTITWDSVDIEELRELTPGQDYGVAFSVNPHDDIKQNPELRLSVSIQANRIGEDRTPLQVVGTVDRLIKIASVTLLNTSAVYTDGPFTNSGPVPPVAEQTTEYTLLLSLKNGSNPITDGEVVAVVPSYVTWLGTVSPEGKVIYNTSDRTLRWNVGDLSANEYREVWVQIALKPSLSQVDTSPTLLETQRFRGTDKFTQTAVRAEAFALTTSLINDPNQSLRDGLVREN